MKRPRFAVWGVPNVWMMATALVGVVAWNLGEDSNAVESSRGWSVLGDCARSLLLGHLGGAALASCLFDRERKRQLQRMDALMTHALEQAGAALRNSHIDRP